MNQCVFRVSGILLMVVIYTAFTVEGVVFGGDCSGGATCDGENTECDGSNACVCTSAAYRKSDGSACALIVATLAGTCDIADTNAAQCSKTDTECTADGGGGKCLCKATHYSDGTDCQTSITYGLACSNAITDTKQCGAANQECLLESGTSNYKCQCTAAYFPDTSACAARKAPDVSCTGDQCVEHATCDTTCKCDAGYTASPTASPTMCSGVVKFASLSYMYVVPILVSMMSLLR